MFILVIIGLACFCCVLVAALISYFYIQDTDYKEEEEDEFDLSDLPEIKGLEAAFIRVEGKGNLGIQEVQVLDKMNRNVLKEGAVDVQSQSQGFIEVDLGKLTAIETVTIINKKPPNPGLAGTKLLFFKEKGGESFKKTKEIASGDHPVYEYDWLARTWRSGPKVGGYEKYGYTADGAKK